MAQTNQLWMAVPGVPQVGDYVVVEHTCGPDRADHERPVQVYELDKLGSGDLRARALRCDASVVEVFLDTAGHQVAWTRAGGRIVDSSPLILGARFTVDRACSHCGSVSFEDRAYSPAGELLRVVSTGCSNRECPGGVR